MVCGKKVREVFSKLLSQWNMCVVDSNGMSRGLLSSWNHNKANFDAFLTPAVILFEGFVKDVNNNMKLVNCYGPCHNRQLFQEILIDDGILKDPDLILGGDLNFTRSAKEIWGSSIRLDPLAYFFNQLI